MAKIDKKYVSMDFPCFLLCIYAKIQKPIALNKNIIFGISPSIEPIILI